MVMAGGKIDHNNNVVNQMKRKLANGTSSLDNAKRQIKTFKTEQNNSLRGGAANRGKPRSMARGRGGRMSSSESTAKPNRNSSLEPPSEMQAMLARMEGYFDKDLSNSDKSDDEESTKDKSESTKDFLDKIRESLETDESSSFLDNLGESLDVDLSSYGKSFKEKERSSSEESTKIIDEIGKGSPYSKSNDDPFAHDREEDLRNKNSSKETIIKNYKNKIDSMKKRHQEVKLEKDKADRLKRKFEENIQKEISERDAEIDELRNSRGGGNRTEREFQELNNTLESFLAEREDYKDDISQLRKERDKADERSKTFQKEHKNFEQIAKIKTSEADSLKVSKEKLEEEHGLMKEKIGKMKTEMSQMKMVNDRITNENSSFKSELSDLKEDTSLCNVEMHESVQEHFEQMRESFLQNNKIKFNSGGDITDEQATRMITETLKEHNNLKEHYVKEIRNSIEKLRGMANKLQQKEKDAIMFEEKLKIAEKEKEKFDELSKNLAQANANLKQKTSIVDSLNKNCQVWSEKFTTLKQEMEKRKHASEDEKKHKVMLAKSEEEQKMYKKKYAETLAKLEASEQTIEKQNSNIAEDSKKAIKVEADLKEKEELEKKLKFAKQHVTDLDAKTKDLEVQLEAAKTVSEQTTETGKVVELKKLLSANEQQLVKTKSESNSIKAQLTKSQQDAEQIKKISLDKIKQTATDVDQRWSKTVKEQKIQIDDYKLKIQILEAYNTQLRTRLGLPLDKNKASLKATTDKAKAVAEEAASDNADKKDEHVATTAVSNPPSQQKLRSSTILATQTQRKTTLNTENSSTAKKQTTLQAQANEKKSMGPPSSQTQAKLSVVGTNNQSKLSPLSKGQGQVVHAQETQKKIGAQVPPKGASQIPTPKKIASPQTKALNQVNGLSPKDVHEEQIPTPKKQKSSLQGSATITTTTNKSNTNVIGVINGSTTISNTKASPTAAPMPKLNVKSVAKLMEDRLKGASNGNNAQTQKLLAALQPIPNHMNSLASNNNSISSKATNNTTVNKTSVVSSQNMVAKVNNNSNNNSHGPTTAITAVSRLKQNPGTVQSSAFNKSGLASSQIAGQNNNNTNLKRLRSVDSITKMKPASILPINSKVSISKVTGATSVNINSVSTAPPKVSNIPKQAVPVPKLLVNGTSKPLSQTGKVAMVPKPKQVASQLKQELHAKSSATVGIVKNNIEPTTETAQESTAPKAKPKLSIRDIMSMTKKPTDPLATSNDINNNNENMNKTDNKIAVAQASKPESKIPTALPIARSVTRVVNQQMKTLKPLSKRPVPISNGATARAVTVAPVSVSAQQKTSTSIPYLKSSPTISVASGLLKPKPLSKLKIAAISISSASTANIADTTNIHTSEKNDKSNKSDIKDSKLTEPTTALEKEQADPIVSKDVPSNNKGDSEQASPVVSMVSSQTAVTKISPSSNKTVTKPDKSEESDQSVTKIPPSSLKTVTIPSSSKMVVLQAASGISGTTGKVSKVGTLSSLSNAMTGVKAKTTSFPTTKLGKNEDVSSEIEASTTPKIPPTLQKSEKAKQTVKAESVAEQSQEDDKEDDAQSELSDSDLNMEDVDDYTNDRESQPTTDNNPEEKDDSESYPDLPLE